MELTNEYLKKLSAERMELDKQIKQTIKDEFKARFKKAGEGLDLYSHASTYVYGMLNTTGEIGKMYLNDDGDIEVLLIQEYEDEPEEFEARYFACDDWPMLLLLVREGIEKNWLIDDEDE